MPNTSFENDTFARKVIRNYVKSLLILILIVGLFLSSCQPSRTAIQTAIEQTRAAIPTATSTITPIPTSTPRPWWNNCFVGKTIMQAQYDLLVSKDNEVCIYGIISDKREVKGKGYIINIFPAAQNEIPYLIIANNDAIWATENIIVNNDPVLATLSPGDCMIAYGYAKRINGGPQFIAVKVSNPILLAMEANNSSVQTIISTCQ